MEATGIVCGVAGRLTQEQGGHIGASLGEEGHPSPRSKPADVPEGIEISFLSTARAGTVIVRANQLEGALKALETGMEEAE